MGDSAYNSETARKLGGSLALQGKDGRNQLPGGPVNEGYGSLRKATEG